ncbi:NUDIX hydrolase [Streptomyces sp. 8L]|uniref:NUDIX hydrolase n=1 Tax=Streptomyces sp. 8L TaxID=2877242 RepID=UPI001CD7722F|nr:NUDIX domain-containing protein [Streptomyces sp. 8L]MCA1223342.1 NUDIX domain-containing protein [Streptomyces sp. 8L]
MRTSLRVAAYAVLVNDGGILLSRLIPHLRDRSGAGRWTLPGGGMDPGEDPFDTVVREVWEETGHTSRMTALLGVDSYVRGDRQGLRILYEGEITGGALRAEPDGSTDLAAWHPLEAVERLPHVELVDVALRLWRERPAVGHVAKASPR